MAELRNDVILDPTVPNTTTSSKAIIATVSTAAPGEWFIGPYTFDCWLLMEQESRLTLTRQPMAYGADEADHCFLEPKNFSFQIGVTETIANNVFAGTASRPVNAYNLLCDLQAKRQFFAIGTKYNTYSNCLITSISASDDFSTQKKLLATVTIEQVIIANSQTFKVSANAQATDYTNRGNVPTHPPIGTEAFRLYYIKKLESDFNKVLN